MKIIIADDHPVFRIGMTYALKNYYGQDTEIMEGNDYAEIFKLVSENPDADFIFCDLEMPDREPEKGLPALVKAAGNIPVLVVSGRDDPQSIQMSLHAGARGYLIKQTTMNILRPVLDLIASGEVYVPSRALGGSMSGSFGWYKTHNDFPLRIAHVLSKRQLEILQALANGLSNKEIARQLGIVESTVKVQLKTIYRKINARNRTEAALAMRFFRDCPDSPDVPDITEGVLAQTSRSEAVSQPA